MTEQPSSIIKQDQRVIRVFVSSTFRDMHAERDELILRIFPQLRKLCEARGVTWSEVDLRWGITEEQSERGEVLPICLAEIQRCRPYFIGLLGERYGWVADEIPPELIAQEPWLQEHLQHSVTELEILHGVLNDTAMANHALFYFRDPAYVDSLAPEQRADYRELPTDAEIARYGQPEAERRAAERRAKLTKLKDKIRTSPFPVVENYANPQALGERVLRDLKEIIDHLYPEGSEPAPLDREALEHEAFAQSHARVYIGRQSYYDRLDEHARGDGPPLVVLGESGAGKSALLANWALRYRTAHTQELLLLHFIGASPYSADWAAMLRRVMGEFKRRFAIQQEIPDKPDELRAAFANWLHMAAVKGKVVLILDALNQLEDRDGAPDLVWLPPVIPANVRLIVSTLPGRALDDLTRRAWPTMQVELLEASERKQLIKDYLGQHAKQLSPARAERIASARQAANPLYLRALLDELRVFGIHEKLDERIERYLTARSAEELYERVLERWEQDYERERPGLVCDVMSLLWAARRGLSEPELLELLSESGEPLLKAYWSPLYLAAEASLVSHSGLIRFGHAYMRQAIQHKYLASAEHRRMAHHRLSDYFERQSLNSRKLDELPWQLEHAHEWERLREALANIPFLLAAWERSTDEVLAYWAQVIKRLRCKLDEVYRAHWRDALETGQDLIPLSELLLITGHTREGKEIIAAQVEKCRRQDDRLMLASALRVQALLLKGEDNHKAQTIYEECAQIYRDLKDERGVAACLGSLAGTRINSNDPGKAMNLLREQEEIAKRLGDHHLLQACLGNQANILADIWGEYEEGMRLRVQAERLCEAMGWRHDLQAHWLNHAGLLKQQGHWEEALRLLEKSEEESRDLNFRDSLSTCLAQQANIYAEHKRWKVSLRKNKEAEELFRELQNLGALSNCLCLQAVNCQKAGDLRTARKKAEEALTLTLKMDFTAREKSMHCASLIKRLRSRPPLISRRLAALLTMIGWFIPAMFFTNIPALLVALITAGLIAFLPRLTARRTKPDGFCPRCGREYVAVGNSGVCLGCGLTIDVSYLEAFLDRNS